MKILVDQHVTMDFDPWSIEQAAKVIEKARREYRDTSHRVLRGMLTLLLFSELESQAPGSMGRFQQQIEAVTKGMKEPIPEGASE